MFKYPLPTTDTEYIIQQNKSEKEIHDVAINHIASEAILHPTFESYMDAVRANTLGSVPAPAEENLQTVIGGSYNTIEEFYNSAINGEIGDIDTVKVQLVRLQQQSGMVVTSPDDLHRYAKAMSDYDREHLKVFHLDAQNKIIGIENIATGTIDRALTHPRELIKGAILNNASGVIIAHNHPSGILDESKADLKMAQNLVNAFALVGMPVLDFVIMADGQTKSFVAEDIMPAASPFVTEMSADESQDACNVAYQAALEVMSDKCE